MDEIMIQNLAVNGVIGIFDWERNIKQKISMDICIGCDISKASISDNIQDAVDYKKISKSIIEFVSKSEFYLIEKLANEVAKLILSFEGAQNVKLKLSKPGALRYSDNVSIFIERSLKDFPRK